MAIHDILVSINESIAGIKSVRDSLPPYVRSDVDPLLAGTIAFNLESIGGEEATGPTKPITAQETGVLSRLLPENIVIELNNQGGFTYLSLRPKSE